MSRLSVLPILLAAALLSTAAAAAPWLSVANGGRDTVWRQRDGHLIVFERPGQMRVQRDFGPGLIGFSAAPDTTRVALWFARATGAEIFVWDYATDHISAAPTESAQTSAGLAWAADGRSLLLARPDLGGLTSVTGFLAPDTFIASTSSTTIVHSVRPSPASSPSRRPSRSTWAPPAASAWSTITSNSASPSRPPCASAPTARRWSPAGRSRSSSSPPPAVRRARSTSGPRRPPARSTCRPTAPPSTWPLRTACSG